MFTAYFRDLTEYSSTPSNFTVSECRDSDGVSRQACGLVFDVLHSPGSKFCHTPRASRDRAQPSAISRSFVDMLGI